MTTTLKERYKRLLLAANALLENHFECRWQIDLGDCFVDEDNDDDDYPTDSDGDRWYHDWFELREAINECESDDVGITLATPEITLQALEAGKIVHTGWTPSRDTAEQCGVNAADYFDAGGKFLGADENGLVPMFELAANYKVVTDAQNTGLDCEVFGTKAEAEQAVEACRSFAFESRKFDVLQTSEPVTTTFDEWNTLDW